MHCCRGTPKTARWYLQPAAFPPEVLPISLAAFPPGLPEGKRDTVLTASLCDKATLLVLPAFEAPLRAILLALVDAIDAPSDVCCLFKVAMSKLLLCDPDADAVESGTSKRWRRVRVSRGDWGGAVNG